MIIVLHIYIYIFTFIFIIFSDIPSYSTIGKKGGDDDDDDGDGDGDVNEDDNDGRNDELITLKAELDLNKMTS